MTQNVERCEHMITAKHKIVEHYVVLLGKNDPSSITVKQIVEHANISRSTFYLYFKDKEDLFLHTKESMLNHLLNTYTIEPSNKVTFELCQHVFKNRNFYKWLFADTSEVYALTLRLYEPLRLAFKSEDFAIFASAGTIGYLTHWIKNDFEISPLKASENLLEIGFSNMKDKLANNGITLNKS